MPHRPTHVEPRQLVRQCLVAKGVLAAFARTAFYGALGMSMWSKRVDGWLHNSKRHKSTSPVALTPVNMFLRDVISADGFLSDIVRSRV